MAVQPAAMVQRGGEPTPRLQSLECATLGVRARKRFRNREAHLRWPTADLALTVALQANHRVSLNDHAGFPARDSRVGFPDIPHFSISTQTRAAARPRAPSGSNSTNVPSSTDRLGESVVQCRSCKTEHAFLMAYLPGAISFYLGTGMLFALFKMLVCFEFGCYW
ncbi:hypothetical protein BDK51DRAFT_37849 [Blyttiomyces helicus]|uniref:LITAF domain-containing protein n=1 Tax=Blyttiomyces helicus TaxID=388810 RepID=A0A4P9WIG4_9FUNG|nr:hypothetical protein BDK51DRAFT_37849 [Blyttiomyces helicus]|eukprot:RKO92661.1 hypothetical protein BDK51DRAFT_37849 [Blyttiomyces helicus]